VLLIVAEIGEWCLILFFQGSNASRVIV